MSDDQLNDNGIYYFLGNIPSHILHALPLFQELGGTFVVLSEKAKREVERYNVPVIAVEDKPEAWLRLGFSVRKTARFLNDRAKVVICYELYDFSRFARVISRFARIMKPTTIFLTHGNMLKSYMASQPRLRAIKQYDYMAALGPHLKRQFIEDYHLDPHMLVDLGIARTDEVVKHRGEVLVPPEMQAELSLERGKKVVSYIPTFWGASSVHDTGNDIVRYFPADYTLIFRPHPQTPDSLLSQYRELIANNPAGNVVYAPEGHYKNVTLQNVLIASSAIIGDLSSVMLEAILLDKPLLFAYGSGENEQDESDYAAIREVVDCSQHITRENVQTLPLLLCQALERGIDPAIWQATKDRTFFHHDGTSVQAIALFVRSML